MCPLFGDLQSLLDWPCERHESPNPFHDGSSVYKCVRVFTSVYFVLWVKHITAQPHTESKAEKGHWGKGHQTLLGSRSIRLSPCLLSWTSWEHPQQCSIMMSYYSPPLIAPSTAPFSRLIAQMFFLFIRAIPRASMVKCTVVYGFTWWWNGPCDDAKDIDEIPSSLPLLCIVEWWCRDDSYDYTGQTHPT